MMKKFLITLGVVLMALTFWPAVILLIVARAKGWKKYGDIAECAVWWHTFSFMLPSRARKLGVISNNIWAWLLVPVSPLAWVVYAIIFFQFHDGTHQKHQEENTEAYSALRLQIRKHEKYIVPAIIDNLDMNYCKDIGSLIMEQEK